MYVGDEKKLYKLKPRGSKISAYGYIVNAKAAHENYRRLGYHIIIKTTYTINNQHEKIPIYIWHFEKNSQKKSDRRIYEWFKTNKKVGAPVYVEGRKRYQKLAKNDKMSYEKAKKVLWIFISRGKVTPLLDGIPEKFKDVEIL